jgi:hypothetical protein
MTRNGHRAFTTKRRIASGRHAHLGNIFHLGHCTEISAVSLADPPFALGAEFARNATPCPKHGYAMDLATLWAFTIYGVIAVHKLKITIFGKKTLSDKAQIYHIRFHGKYSLNEVSAIHNGQQHGNRTQINAGLALQKTDDSM